MLTKIKIIETKNDKPVISAEQWQQWYLPWGPEERIQVPGGFKIRRAIDYTEPLDFTGYVLVKGSKKTTYLYKDIMRRGGKDWYVQVAEEHTQAVRPLLAGEELEEDAGSVLLIGSPSGKMFKEMVCRRLGKISHEDKQKIVETIFEKMSKLIKNPERFISKTIQNEHYIEEQLQLDDLISRILGRPGKACS